MKLLSYAFIIGFLIFSYGCQKNNDIDFGLIELEEGSKDIIPYVGEEVLNFRDSTGDILRLVSQPIQDGVTMSSSSACYGFWAGCETMSYSVNQYSIYFEGSKRSDGNQSIRINLSVAPTLQSHLPDFPEEYGFFDVFSISYRGEESFHLQKVLNKKDREDIEIRDLYKRFREVDEIILLGEKFENVTIFWDENGDRRCYYSKEKGIIGLIDEDGTTWVLEN